MHTTDEIIDYLKNNLSEIRFNHTIGVAETAKSLARLWKADCQKAYIAGLIHDCAKEIPADQAIELLRQYEYPITEYDLEAPALLHAPLGAYMAKEVFGVTDTEILDAVRYHTTGRVDMTLLEKIIYVADFTEPGRKYSESETVRQLSQTDIDEAALKEADIVIKFTIDKGKIIHPDTILARNSMLKRGKTNET